MSDEEFFREIRESIIDNTSKMLENAGSPSDRKGLAKDSNKNTSPDLHKGETASKLNGTENKTESGTSTGEPSSFGSDPTSGPKGKENSKKPKEPNAKVKEMRQDSGNGGGGDNASPESVNKVAMELATLQLEPGPAQSKKPPFPAPKNTVNSAGAQVQDADGQHPPPGVPKTQQEKAAEKKLRKEARRKEKPPTEKKLRKDAKRKARDVAMQQDSAPAGDIDRLKQQIEAIVGQIEELKKGAQNGNVTGSLSSSHSSSGKREKGQEKNGATSSSKEAKQQPAPTTSQVVTGETSNGNDKLGPEQKLILQLHCLSSHKRAKLVELLGLELGVLRPHPHKKGFVVVDKKFTKLTEGLVDEAKQRIANAKESIAAPATTNEERKEQPAHATKASKAPTTPNSKSGKRSGRGTYEDQVTYMLNDGKHCAEEDYDPRRILVDIRDKEKEIIQKRLDAFVQSLVVQNFGYVIDGLLRINARNNMQSFVDDTSRTGNIYINSILLRRCAMEGDRVRVFVKHPSDEAENASGEENGEDEPDAKLTKNNAGFVVEILEKRHNRQCVGRFLPVAAGKKHYRMFAPRDMRIPAMRVFKQDWPNALLDVKIAELKDDQDADGENTKVPQIAADVEDVTQVLYQAEIIEWQDEVPIATILKSIGKCGVLEVENESILVEHNLDVTPYGDDILAQLPAVPYTIPLEELARREDLRRECIFTIDPATARDLDDALSCKQLENGNYQIGVHISDVTYFLREGSPLDELVKQRATSIYMVDTVYHMLPKQLCNTCSLLPGEDKLAFSVFWEMEPDGTVLSTRFARTVINSCSQLSYEHAQLMLDNPDCKVDGDQFPEILHGYDAKKLCKIVNILQSIAVKLRQRRMDDGCLKINQPKLTFRLNPATGRPIEYGVYKLRTSNEMIEDFMLLANQSVATAIYKAFPAISLLRAHSPPAENMMKNLVRTLAHYGYALSYTGPKDIRECMEVIIARSENPDATASVLSVLLAKPMIRAQYYCSSFATTPENFAHYALAIPMYTHFTSPIRRYADCLVHRVLAAMLGIDELPKRTPEELQCLAMICNEKKYNAKCAGEASSLLYFRHWLTAVGEYETDAAVMSYAAHYLELVLIHSGIVLKAMPKKFAAVASYLYKPTEPVGSCLLVPTDTTIPPLELLLFTKVRVTVKVVNNAITVCSVLPITTTKDESAAPVSPSVEQSVNDLSEETKSARAY